MYVIEAEKESEGDYKKPHQLTEKYETTNLFDNEVIWLWLYQNLGEPIK